MLQSFKLCKEMNGYLYKTRNPQIVPFEKETFEFIINASDKVDSIYIQGCEDLCSVSQWPSDVDGVMWSSSARVIRAGGSYCVSFSLAVRSVSNGAWAGHFFFFFFFLALPLEESGTMLMDGKCTWKAGWMDVQTYECLTSKKTLWMSRGKMKNHSISEMA